MVVFLLTDPAMLGILVIMTTTKKAYRATAADVAKCWAAHRADGDQAAADAICNWYVSQGETNHAEGVRRDTLHRQGIAWVYGRWGTVAERRAYFFRRYAHNHFTGNPY